MIGRQTETNIEDALKELDGLNRAVRQMLNNTSNTYTAPMQDNSAPSFTFTAGGKNQREIRDVLREALQRRESKKSAKPSAVTKRQIQALTKEHLYLIILDQDDEIRQLKEDMDKINRAFHAGYAVGRG